MNEEGDAPYNVADAAAAVVHDLLPTKSKERYEKAYETFNDWCRSKAINELTEDVFLAYFGEKANTYKPSSLWSTFSMLKSTLMVERDLNIGRFCKLIAFLKKKNKGYQPKKSKIFSKDEVDKFLLDAPDKEFLLMKVTLIMGLAGAMRCDELVKLTLDDVDEKDNMLIVKLRETKTYKPRSFVVIEGNNKINILLYKKYVALRSPHTPHRRVFVSYRGGKCTVQPVGLHTFAKMPAKIAKFLQLPQPELYTGHCLRRSSATLLVDGGGDLTVLKRHGGWRSSSVAENYIDESLQSKLAIANQIQCQQTLTRTETNGMEVGQCLLSKENTSNLSVASTNADVASTYHVAVSKTSSKTVPPSINISNVQNTSINININV